MTIPRTLPAGEIVAVDITETEYMERFAESHPEWARGVVGDPFVMRLDAISMRRQPDLQVIFNTNPGTLTNTDMDGPADICIEVVSPGSGSTDYGDKLAEAATLDPSGAYIGVNREACIFAAPPSW